MTDSAKRPRIVCASSLALGREYFSTIGDVEVVAESEISRETIREADILVTRSKVQVNERLVDGSSLKFYGTATAGFDHVDTQALSSRGISWAQAPGSNANSVAEYVLASLARIGLDDSIDWEGKTIGIVGAGHVGSRLAKHAQAFGLNVLLNDPPLFDQTGDGRYLPLDDVLARSDIITLHVPLIDDGDHPTRAMVNDSFLSKMNAGSVFINTSRGEVVDEQALVRAIQNGRFSHTVLDVFENEPTISAEILALATIATPHIAGYSYDGRVKGTAMVYRAACKALGIKPVSNTAREEDPKTIHIQSGGADSACLYRAVIDAYDPRIDDENLRAFPKNESIGNHFKAMRTNYPKRLEFEHCTVSAQALNPRVAGRLKSLGFIIQSPA